MSSTQTTTMPNAQPSIHQCPDSQFCPACDPTPGLSRERPRFCEHNQRTTFVAANHRCPPRTVPSDNRTTSGFQLGPPQASPSVHDPRMQPTQYPQGYAPAPGPAHGNNYARQYPDPQQGNYSYQPPMNRSPQDYNHDYAHGVDRFENLQAIEHARAHWGRNYATEPQYRRGAYYGGIVVGGRSVTHTGDNIGYPELETERLARIPHLSEDDGHTDFRDRYNGDRYNGQ